MDDGVLIAPGEPVELAGAFQQASAGRGKVAFRAFHSQQLVARDPILFDGGTASLYEYCGNDPVNCTDPSGMAAETGWDLFWLATSAGIFAAEPNICSAADVVADLAAMAIPGLPSKGPAKLGWL